MDPPQPPGVSTCRVEFLKFGEPKDQRVGRVGSGGCYRCYRFFWGELFAHFLLFFFHETCFFFPGLGDVKLGMDFFAPNGDLCFWVGSRVTSAFRSEF